VLEEILRIKIKDEQFIRYIIRMFKAGVLTSGELTVSTEGVVQGSCVSPILSNILAHYVIDTWFEESVKAHCRGKVELFRYSDDLVICCQTSTDAERIKDALSKRLKKFKLRMNEEKTKMVQFNRKENQATSFNFLGFTFYWGRSQKGCKIPKVKTEGKRLRAKLKKVNEWARSVRHKGDTHTIWKSFCKKLQGHIQYYGVSFNTKQVATFVYRAIGIMFYWLNRRSQKKSFTRAKFAGFMQRHPPPAVRVYHRLF
ncbi:MAG: reverse transcriptase domain-containing protein, partial [Gammaproteobacteria bacterium]